jgi:hypothetical protein
VYADVLWCCSVSIKGADQLRRPSIEEPEALLSGHLEKFAASKKVM